MDPPFTPTENDHTGEKRYFHFRIQRPWPLTLWS